MSFQKQQQLHTLQQDKQWGRLDFVTEELIITSDGDTLSLMWVGVSENLQISKVYDIDMEAMHFTCRVVLTNVGPEALEDVMCECRMLLDICDCNL